MLKELIADRGYSIAEFADALTERWAIYTGRKCSKMAIYRWCDGEHSPFFQPVELREFLKLLDIDNDQLIEMLERIKTLRNVGVLPDKDYRQVANLPDGKYPAPRKKNSKIS